MSSSSESIGTHGNSPAVVTSDAGTPFSHTVRTTFSSTLRLLTFGILLAGLSAGCEAGQDGPAGPKPLDRGTFYVEIQETLEGEKCEPNISQILITKKMLLHGFRRVTERDKARYSITGKLNCTFHKQLTFDFQETSQHLEWQYRAAAEVSVRDEELTKKLKAEGKDPDVESSVAFVDIPELINGRIEKESAKKDIRRYAGTILADRIVGETFLTDVPVQELIRALGNTLEERTFNKVQAELVALGGRAVPYLLTGMVDERPVVLPGEYSGLEEWNKKELKFYHIADAALVEIFERESGIRLDSSEDYIKRVNIAWLWLWEDIQGIPKDFRTRPGDRANTVPAATGQTPEAKSKPEATPKSGTIPAGGEPSKKPASESKPASQPKGG